MNEELSIKQQIRHSHIHKQYTAYDYDGQLSFIHSHFATITFQPFTLPDSHGLAMKFLEYPLILWQESEKESYVAELQSAAEALWRAAAEDTGQSQKQWTAEHARSPNRAGGGSQPIRFPLCGVSCVSEGW